MTQFGKRQSRKLHFSLSARVSALLILVAILPLLVTFSSIELISRPALITQAGQEMATDAQTHTQLIDNYLSERLLEAESLSRLQPIQNFLAGNQDLQAGAMAGLATGHGRGSYYEDWSLFDLRGNMRLYYPAKPQLHGSYYILPNAQKQVITTKKSVFSDIFFSPASNEAYIDIYTPIFTAAYQLVGILRTSFDLQYVWQTVDSEAGTNGPGSYAFILDQNGVRIAYTRASTDPDPTNTVDAASLFKSVVPITEDLRQRAVHEGLYGWHANSNAVLTDSALASAQRSTNASLTFQMVPATQNETFQAARSSTFTVPWNYYVLSPLNTVTRVADQQLFVAFIITSIVLVLAALIGLMTGRGITRPILRSVTALIHSSQSLKTLADKQQSAAEEQRWVVEASQTGLQRLEYYSNATHVAAGQLSEIGTGLARNWNYLDEKTLKRSISGMISSAQYIDKARSYQEESDKNLAAAIRVTTSVSEQLSQGASSAAEAAVQLEEVVNQLRAVV